MKHIKEVMILSVCLMILGFSASLIFGIWCMYQEGVKEYQGLQVYIEAESEKETDENGAVLSTIKTEVDFDALKAINEDIVAWIKCEALGLNYPVVQGSDNEYYLSHTFLGTEHISGCIFMDCLNRADFSDDNTILYGHNMKNGSMFGSFCKTTKAGTSVYIYTQTETLEYGVIDNRVVDISEDLYFKVRYGEETFESLCDAVVLHSGVQLAKGDQILTLSTCNGNENERWIILCRKLVEGVKDFS